MSKFTRMVNATAISANLDNLEGGLDALMQVIVCEEQVIRTLYLIFYASSMCYYFTHRVVYLTIAL